MIKKKPKSFKLGKLTISLHNRLGYNSKHWLALKKYCEKRDGGKRCIKSNEDCYGSTFTPQEAIKKWRN